MKQTLRASGSNMTPKHMEHVSLCAFFLLQVAKQTDLQLQVPHQMTHHNTRDASQDIIKMATYLLGERVSCECRSGGHKFDDPLIRGTKKIGAGVVEKYINNTNNELDPIEDTENIVDIGYELHNTD